jgi:hypothetical protein
MKSLDRWPPELGRLYLCSFCGDVVPRKLRAQCKRHHASAQPTPPPCQHLKDSSGASPSPE